jgi:DHA1 family bicyclomycin/chloramphenicol resistance-like MFS transporter
MSNSESTKWSGRAARRLIAVLLLVAPLEQVGFDIYTPALPKIAAHFAASNALVQNTVTAYMLGMALVVLPAGLIADAIGRKRMLLSGLGLMVATSIGCAVADSLPLMIGLRFLGGMGAGTCLLLAAAIAADCFRGTGGVPGGRRVHRAVRFLAAGVRGAGGADRSGDRACRHRPAGNA